MFRRRAAIGARPSRHTSSTGRVSEQPGSTGAIAGGPKSGGETIGGGGARRVKSQILSDAPTGPTVAGDRIMTGTSAWPKRTRAAERTRAEGAKTALVVIVGTDRAAEL